MSVAAVLEWVGSVAEWGGTPWVLLALALSTFASDDLACVAGGLLVAAGRLDFWSATLACFIGIVVGDLILVAAGRCLGRAALQRWPLRGRVSAEGLARAESWFAQRGGRAIFISRFVPGTRLPLYLAAGVLRAPWGRLALWFAAAVAVWAPLVLGLSWKLGAAVVSDLHDWAEWSGGLALAALLAGAGLRLGQSLASWRGRRLWVSRLRRLTHWEYWPSWAVYPPVVVYALWLGWRHGGWTVCTAANPGIGAGGGLVGESKSEILRGLADAGERVATWTLIEPGPVTARVAAVEAFQAELPMAWPVVLKPDVGERGQGVVIARSSSEVVEKLTKDPVRLIAQAYVAGVEFGLFYARHPAATQGELFAITDKRVLRVAGDGRRTLEELILADERAVGMATFFLDTYSARAGEVPEAGASVLLAELGTHCRGALFLDGEQWRTSELEAAVEAVSATFKGFHFGRYDVRTESAEALQRGEFTVIELNGLSSEATSIYDPKHSVWFGWRTLCRQWRLAFEIGAANRARGARVWTFSEVRALLDASGSR